MDDYIYSTICSFALCWKISIFNSNKSFQLIPLLYVEKSRLLIKTNHFNQFEVCSMNPESFGINKIGFVSDLYKEHSIKKVNFVPGVGNRKHCKQLHPFQRNHSDGSFHVPKDCQQDFYWPLCPEHFLCRMVNVSPLHELSLRFRDNVGNPCFASTKKCCSPPHTYILLKWFGLLGFMAYQPL